MARSSEITRRTKRATRGDATVPPTVAGVSQGRRQSRAGRRRPVADREAAERAALWADPAFQAALEEGRASLAKDGGIAGEELDQRLGITDDDREAAAAWLDEYERRLEAETRTEQA